MANGPVSSGMKRGNLPPLEFYVPEPKYRPGDAVNYSDFVISAAGAQPRPDETCEANETHPLCTDMIRILDEDKRAVGPWDPRLDPETLHRILRTMALTRAFEDRMTRAQRQGKTSFYMKSTGEEAIAVAAAFALDHDDMVITSYRQQGLLIVTRFGAVHMGIATQTPSGLMVPVIRHAQDRNLW